MNNEFIPYEQALELKELGFDEECLDYYPILWQQAFRWFREKYQLVHSVLQVGSDWHKTLEFTYSIDGAIYIKECCTKTYEEAELACLKQLIEIAKNK